MYVCKCRISSQYPDAVGRPCPTFPGTLDVKFNKRKEKSRLKDFIRQRNAIVDHSPHHRFFCSFYRIYTDLKTMEHITSFVNDKAPV